MPLAHLQSFLSQKLQNPVLQIKSVGGGCINQSYKITTADKYFFCKLNSASKFPHLFEKEKNGLELIQKHNVIKTPGIIDSSIIGNEQILTLEWIEEGNRKDEFWKTFGQQLAALHQISTEEFGLKEDNYMGSVPQINRQEKNWVLFFRANRLEPLVKLCVNKNLLQPKHQEQFEILYQRLLQIFDNEKPALIHGDLWSGNYMCDKKGMPVLIDPAVYFGHRSVDLAMTTLFGDFHKSFYQAYHHYFPLPENYREQWNACNLYPLLIHLYLFGKSYLSKIEQTLDQFC